MPRSVAQALVALALIAVAGCGGDGGGEKDDERAIRDVIRLSLTRDDHRGDCDRRLSSELIRKTYGTRTRCIQVQADDEDDSADAVSFSRVRVDGGDATAGIRVRGGESDGATGEFQLVREDGDWRIDGISVPLLRSLVEVGLQSGEGGLPAGGPACMSRALRRLPDAEFQRLAYQMIGETDAAQRRTLQILADCPDNGGRSLLFETFQQGIVESLRQRGSGQREIRCIVDRLRRDLSDDELLEALSRENSQAATTRLITPAVSACDR